MRSINFSSLCINRTQCLCNNIFTNVYSNYFFYKNGEGKKANFVTCLLFYVTCLVLVTLISKRHTFYNFLKLCWNSRGIHGRLTLALWDQEADRVSELLGELPRWSLHDFSNRQSKDHLTLKSSGKLMADILLFSGTEFHTITLQSLFEQISNFSFAIFCRIQCFSLVVRHSIWKIIFLGNLICEELEFFVRFLKIK